ncbi:MAG TPA: site-specific integrase [Thermoplasmata archaeon]|nr:site-specific integrase [Thermoplasmata archaeon]
MADERVPDPSELRRLLAVLSTRDRAAVLFLATSGVRIGVLASRFEANGLTLNALPDLVIGPKTIRFENSPPLVCVPAPLSKSRKAYYTFITSEAAEALLAYLQDRRSRGEELAACSSVIGPEPKASHAHFRVGREDSHFISGKSLGNVIRIGLRKVMPKGVRVRPHTLRAWTSTQLELAERKGKITRSLREYFLGHNLRSVELRYNLGKKLSQESIEELRAVFRSCEPFLSTQTTPSATSDEIQREAAVLLLTGFKGKTEIDARKLVEGKSGPELAELIKSGAKPREQAFAVEEVPRLLGVGWEFVSVLNGTMAVLRAPAGSLVSGAASAL